MRTVVVALALGSGLGLVACDEGAPSSPTAPTVTTDAANRPRLPLRADRRSPVVLAAPDPRFRDQFWRELIFDQNDSPGTLNDRWTITWPLPTTSPHFYLKVDDRSGHRVVARKHLDHMRRSIPGLAQQLTGHAYGGRIQEGSRNPRRDSRGWITVEFVTVAEVPEIKEFCGRAGVGADPGYVQIVRDGDNSCLSDSLFPKLFAHELGHAFGLRHVADKSAIMLSSGGSGGIERFNEHEEYHSRLVYRVGRWKRYCGWPFSAECSRVNRFGFSAVPPMLPPVVVFD